MTGRGFSRWWGVDVTVDQNKSASVAFIAAFVRSTSFPLQPLSILPTSCGSAAPVSMQAAAR